MGGRQGGVWSLLEYDDFVLFFVFCYVDVVNLFEFPRVNYHIIYFFYLLV